MSLCTLNYKRMTLNIYDIIIAIILVWALISGYRKGIIVQACQLAGLLLGLWLGFRFCKVAGGWLGYEEISPVVAFAVLFLVTVLVAALIGRLTRSIAKVAGLGFLDRFVGIVLSVVKVGVLTSLAMGLFIRINNNLDLVDSQPIEDAVLVEPLQRLSDAVLPLLLDVATDILEEGAEGIEKIDGTKVI